MYLRSYYILLVMCTLNRICYFTNKTWWKGVGYKYKLLMYFTFWLYTFTNMFYKNLVVLS